MLTLWRRYPAIAARAWHRSLNFGPCRRQFYADYWAHAAAALGARISQPGSDYWLIEKHSAAVLVQFHHLASDSYFHRMLVDDKSLVRRLVAELGFAPAPAVAFDLANLGLARTFLADSRGPCVVKPRAGASGRGITTGVNTPARLRRAALAASDSFRLPPLLIERQREGDCYRLLYLEGQLLHAVRRGRPSLIGDGQSTVKALLAAENRQRLAAAGQQAIGELCLDLDARLHLQDAGLSPAHVPKAGERITLKGVANQNQRRDQTQVTDQVHEDFRRLGQSLFAALGTHLLGVDLMAGDIAAPGDQATVLEINIPPGLHYHELVADQNGFGPVGPRVLEFLLARPGHLARVDARRLAAALAD